MVVKFILPALTEAKGIYWRSIKYSLFPPLGLATLAGQLSDADEAILEDEHVQELNLDDHPDIVAIQVYITSAYRAYAIADHYRRNGVYVVLGGLHVTSMPGEAEMHADTICIGPGEDTWPHFLGDFRKGKPRNRYFSHIRSLDALPLPRRDLIRKDLYLVPNSIVVSRGCPHHCDFCYKDDFFKGGKSFYVQHIDRILAEIESLPGRHLYFLDDHLFGNRRFAMELFTALRGMHRVWQAAGTVSSLLDAKLTETAVASGLGSIFIGFETLKPENLSLHRKVHNNRTDYDLVIRALHGYGVMVNSSFVFGMDADGPDVFQKTVDWALSRGLETATFHILTPYPGTRLYEHMMAEGRIVTQNWDLYDTRHAVIVPRGMSADQLEEGYQTAYRDFYKFSSILQSVATKESLPFALRHFLYTTGWKKLEPFWEFIIRKQHVYNMVPLLERLLSHR